MFPIGSVSDGKVPIYQQKRPITPGTQNAVHITLVRCRVFSAVASWVLRYYLDDLSTRCRVGRVLTLQG